MNSILRRRRALMGKSRKVALENVPVGALVLVDSDNFVNIGVVDGVSLLLRDMTLSSQRSMGKSSAGFYDYDSSTIDKYLTGTYYKSFDAKIKNRLVNTQITYPASDGTDVVDKTISRKVFLPTSSQLGASGEVTSALKICKNTDNLYTARIALRQTTSAAVLWWTMSAYSTNTYLVISDTGTVVQKGQDTGGVYVRPMLSMDKSVMTELQNGVYVCKF